MNCDDNTKLLLHIYLKPKKPSLKIYQDYARIYLDEYPNQEELRKNFFALKWNLQNSSLKRLA